MKEDTKDRRSAIGSLGLTDQQMKLLQLLAESCDLTPSEAIARAIENDYRAARDMSNYLRGGGPG